MCLRVPVFMWVIISFHLRIFSGLKWCQTHTHLATVQQCLCQLTSQFTYNVWLLLIIDKPILVKACVKLRNLQTLQNCQLWHNFFFFQFTSKFLYIIEMYIVQSVIPKYVDPVTKRTIKFPDSCFGHFLNWKSFSNIWKGSQSLSKSTSKYLVYYQVFEVEVRRL